MLCREAGASAEDLVNMMTELPGLVEVVSSAPDDVLSQMLTQHLPRKHLDLNLVSGLSVAEIEGDRQRWLARGDDSDVVDKRIEQMFAERDEVDHFFHVGDDDLFTSRDVIKEMMLEIREFHRTNREPIQGTVFEWFMAKIWENQGWEVAMPDPTNPGRDLEVRLEDQNDWILISAKSENRARARKGKIDIESLAPHYEDPIERAEDCQEAVRQAVEHLGRYQRMIYIRSIRGSSFPHNRTKPAHRYDLVEVPKEEMGNLMLQQATADAFLRAFKRQAEFRDKRKSGFNIPIERDGDTMFSVTVKRGAPGKNGHVRIGSIDVARFCTVISQFWTEPLPSRRSDRPRD